MKNIERQVMGFLADFPADQPIARDTELMEAGVLDSTGLVRLILFLESEFKIIINDHEIAPESFSSPAAIASFVESKIAA